MKELQTILTRVQPFAIALTFIAVYVTEHLIPARKEHVDHKHDVQNVLVGLVNLVIAGLGGFALQRLLIYTTVRQFGLLHLVSNNPVVQLLFGLILIDLFMYWWHRANHEWRFLWQFHRFHHKDEKLNSTSAVRFHFVELSLSVIIRLILFPLLGLQVANVVLYGIILFPVIVFHHSNVQISLQADLLLRKLFVTPHMHRIHHSKILAETNSNYGSVFPYWDALFKSYIRKPAKEIEFGVD